MEMETSALRGMEEAKARFSCVRSRAHYIVIDVTTPGPRARKSNDQQTPVSLRSSINRPRARTAIRASLRGAPPVSGHLPAFGIVRGAIHSSFCPGPRTGNEKKPRTDRGDGNQRMPPLSTKVESKSERLRRNASRPARGTRFFHLVRSSVRSPGESPGVRSRELV